VVLYTGIAYPEYKVRRLDGGDSINAGDEVKVENDVEVENTFADGGALVLVLWKR